MREVAYLSLIFTKLEQILGLKVYFIFQLCPFALGR